MLLNKNLLDYLEFTNVPKCTNSNFLITDLEKVLFSSTCNSIKDYESSKLSESIINLIEKWHVAPVSNDLFLMQNNPTFSITKSNLSKPSSIMIFPVYVSNKLEGLTIFYRNTGNYISTSSKAPNTIRNWIMKFLN